MDPMWLGWFAGFLVGFGSGGIIGMALNRMRGK